MMKIPYAKQNRKRMFAREYMYFYSFDTRGIVTQESKLECECVVYIIHWRVCSGKIDDEDAREEDTR